MHRLRLMSFEENPEESQESREVKEKPEKILNSLEAHADFSNNVEPKASIPNIQSGSDNLTRKKTLRKSLSELFRLASYGIRPSPKILRRQRIHDLKHTIMSNNILCPNKIKEKLLSVRKSKDKIKGNKKRNLNEKLFKSDDIKVLFTSSNWKAKRKPPLALFANRRKYNSYYDSKSSSNSHGFTAQNNRHICCRLQLPGRLRYHKHQDTKNNRDSCHHKHCRHFYSDLTIKPKKSYFSEYIGTPFVHYNLVDFPGNIAKKRAKEAKNKDLCVQVKNESKINLPRYRCVTRYSNKEVSVTPSCLPCLRGGGDAAVDISTQVATRKRVHQAVPKKTCQKAHIHKCRANQQASKGPVFLANTALKYILFSFSIIVWSPCILITFFIWILTYPMRPQEVICTENLRHKKCPKHRRGFWFSIYSFSAAFMKKLTYFYDAVFSSLKSDKEVRKCHNKRRHSQCVEENFQKKVKSPNPDKTYTLFYNDKRGWVMKPVKNTDELGIHEKDFENNYTVSNMNICTNKNDVLLQNKNIQLEEGNLKDNINICRKTEKMPKYTGKKWRPKSFKKREHLLRCLQKQKSKCIHDNIQTTLIMKDNQEYPATHFEICQEIPVKQKIERPYIEELSPQIFAKRENVPVYALQKSRKYVTFDDDCRQRISQYDPCSVIPSPCPFDPHYYLPGNQCPSSGLFMSKRLSPCRCLKNVKKNKKKQRISNNAKCRRCDNVQKKSVRKGIYKETKIPKSNKGNERVKRRKTYKNKYESNYCRRFKNKIFEIVNDVENSVWNCDTACKGMFVQTLRRRPCFWLYRRMPTFYPYFLIFYKFYENLAHAMLFIITACIWCPMFFWCYFCSVICCRCFYI